LRSLTILAAFLYLASALFLKSAAKETETKAMAKAAS